MSMSNDLIIKQIIETDKIIHEPARIVLLSILNAVEEVDFTFLLNETGLSQGNLSSHLSKLESAGYINIEKTFRKKRPRTIISMVENGKIAFKEYLKTMKKFYNTI
jgi:DNA-binding transcriptional ArsR family regulator